MKSAIEEVKKFIRTIDKTHIYYTLRKLGYRRISDSQVKIISIFIALNHFGIEIVRTNLIREFFNKSGAATYGILHLLGDRGILTLVHGEKNRQLRYILSPKFLELYNRQQEPKDLNTRSG